jgi:hypothetical protein
MIMLSNMSIRQHLLILLTISLSAVVLLGVIIYSRQNNNSDSGRQELTTNSAPNMQQTVTREPYVAGQFYPAEAQELDQTVESLLASTQAKVDASLKDKSPYIIIVPHAGYAYSAETAAAAFAQLDSKQIDRVFLLGSSHQVYLQKAALADHTGWKTPLGTVALDVDLVQQLAASEAWEINNQAHSQEHSLEVELPFLQQQLGEFQLIPILVGQLDSEHIEQVVQDMADNFDQHSLLVISSDLSHYPNYELANQVDQELIAAILKQDLNQFEQLAAETDPDQNLQTRACGHQAIKIGLKLAEMLNFNQTQLYDYRNSGDVTGDLSQVVGYAAIGFYGQVAPETQNIVQAAGDANNQQVATSDFSAQAVSLARQALEAYVNKREPSKPLNLHPRLQEPLGVFVTLKNSGTLRGCMGLIESDKPLWQGIQKMTKAAALEDPRFPAVRPDELDKIELEVSVLTQPVLVQDPTQVEAGKHGVIIRYGSQQGVFLPQVATEQGYDREQFLNNLCSHKLGLAESCWQDPQAKIYVFEAEVYAESNYD